MEKIISLLIKAPKVLIYRTKRGLKHSWTFLKTLCRWFILAEQKYADNQKFENKYIKITNILRLGVLFLAPFIVPILTSNKKASLSKILIDLGPLAICIGLLSVYFIVRLYATWLYNIWEFLKNGRVLAFIVVAVIIVLLFIGLKLYPILELSNRINPPSQQVAQNTKTATGNSTTSEVRNIDADKFIDRLTSFYSTLFAIVGLVVALASLGAWNTIKESREKLQELKKMEERVDHLMQKKELAKWVRDKFDKDDDRRCLSSYKLEIEDKNKLEMIEDQVLEETTDDSWLKMLYAKLLIDKIPKDTIYCDDQKKIEQIFKRADNILKYIDMRDLFKENSDIEFIVYHLRGTLYWAYYKYRKEEYKMKHREGAKDIDWKTWWNKKDINRYEHTQKELLDEGVKNYLKAI